MPAKKQELVKMEHIYTKKRGEFHPDNVEDMKKHNWVVVE